ncbi:MAG: hypothetical protein AAF580_01770, partial [Pseudomonadota bacterium]
MFGRAIIWGTSEAFAPQSFDIRTAQLGVYLFVADSRLNLLSVFDDLRYDRSDADMLSPTMRRHVSEKLRPLGFKQISGTTFENPAADVRFLMPKSHALGASPFDISRYTPKREQDFYVLTPTQAACQIIDNYSLDFAVDAIKDLISRQPVNLLRLADYLERKPTHQRFAGVLG